MRARGGLSAGRRRRNGLPHPPFPPLLRGEAAQDEGGEGQGGRQGAPAHANEGGRRRARCPAHGNEGGRRRARCQSHADEGGRRRARCQSRANEGGRRRARRPLYADEGGRRRDRGLASRSSRMRSRNRCVCPVRGRAWATGHWVQAPNSDRTRVRMPVPQCADDRRSMGSRLEHENARR